MSKLKVNELDTESGTTITVASGKTVVVPAGATISVAGTQTVTGAQTNTGTLDISGATVTLPATLPATALTNATNIPAAQLSGQVPVANLGNVDTSGLEADIALLAFKTQANGNLARYNLIDQWVDAFEDGSGIDNTLSSVNSRDAAGKYYVGDLTPTGGTITTYGSYTVHSFTSTGTFFSGAGTVDILAVGGGGGGGGLRGGGGGAGGVLALASQSIPQATNTVTVGLGGTGGVAGGAQGGDGGNSQFGSLTAAVGGGGGGFGSSNPTTAGRAGGSGGGSSTSGALAGGAGTPGQGNAGGQSAGGGAGGYGASGGGGASAAGTGGTGGETGGAGGNGTTNDYRTGSNVTYGGGGGGSSNSTTTAKKGAGGSGGGGTGSNNDPSPSGSAGTDGLGGGGGGGSLSNDVAGHDGGDGLVVVRYTTGSITGTGNMTLVSNAYSAATAPTKADLVMTYSNGTGTAVLGTNITAEASMDGGTTWTDFAIAPSDSQGTTGGNTIVTKSNITLTSTSGTSMRWRIKTLVQSSGTMVTRIHAVSLGWS